MITFILHCTSISKHHGINFSLLQGKPVSFHCFISISTDNSLTKFFLTLVLLGTVKPIINAAIPINASPQYPNVKMKMPLLMVHCQHFWLIKIDRVYSKLIESHDWSTLNHQFRSIKIHVHQWIKQNQSTSINFVQSWLTRNVDSVSNLQQPLAFIGEEGYGSYYIIHMHTRTSTFKKHNKK